MTVPGIQRITVVGAGNMGHQIALSAAIAGYKVKCTDVAPQVLAKAEKFADTYLPERVAKGKMSEDVAKQARANIAFVSKIEEAAADADFVIEAILERIDLKRKVFAQLDALAPKSTILATNSSFIVSSKIADVTKRPDRVCNMHFFNPALVMKLVEVVKGPHVSEETAKTTMEVARSMGKIPVLLKKEVDGFLVNRVLSAFMQEVYFLKDTGVADVEAIDNAVVHGLGHPMGPFRLADLTGIDLSYDIMMGRYRESGNPADKPSPSICEKYFKGEWGRKTGKGYYDYSKE